MAKNEWENDNFDFLQAVYSAYKKLGQFFFHNCLLTCSEKDTSVLLKVLNSWVNKLRIKTMVLTFLKILCICTQSL